MSRLILVVDDEDSIRALVRFVLERVGGWRVLAVASGSEALVQAESVQPDAILMDVMMPEMDGPTTVGHLQANPRTRHIPNRHDDGPTP
jgi:CheY-like chemotaxis protein